MTQEEKIAQIQSKFSITYSKASLKSRIIKLHELIGDNYQSIEDKDWGHLLIIPDEIDEQIEADKDMATAKKYSTKPRITFMSQSKYDFKCQSRKQREAERALREEERKQYPNGPKIYGNRQGKGIYCIKHKGDIIYIGMTNKSFQERWECHRRYFLSPDQCSMKLYHSNLETKDLTFEVVVDITQLDTDSPITKRDLKAMECAFINYFRPSLNVSGISLPYFFEKRNEESAINTSVTKSDDGISWD